MRFKFNYLFLGLFNSRRSKIPLDRIISTINKFKVIIYKRYKKSKNNLRVKVI
jgi:hypothetical protein